MELVSIIAEISQYEKIIANPDVQGNQRLHAQMIGWSLCACLRWKCGFSSHQIIALVDAYDAAASKS